MSKKMLPILGICVVILIAVVWLINRGPNAEQKAIHTATVCNTLQKLAVDADQSTLVEEAERFFKKSTPSYALSQPKYYAGFVAKKIDQYLAMNPTDQANVRQDYAHCFKALADQ
ncbi:hypothetical protein G9F31_08200 [Acinetobacter sp. 187]|uniref:hypothetical protein n=1 Tax=Acinetobacter lanii TaxID=2715163 RepID=UPI00140E427C|nr:hypothetical protein [Acinetobacter lanii]NHC03755.1 hypothetical protein [Acinetobacter lanii]